MTQTDLTSICKITDPETGLVLMQQRLLSWKGVSFPGGHVENNESFYDSIIREVFEETGLTIENPRFVGSCHFINRDSGEREIIFCYVANRFTGNLVKETVEGINFWVKPCEVEKQPLSPGLLEQLPVFTDDGVFRECFVVYGEGGTTVQWKGEAL